MPKYLLVFVTLLIFFISQCPPVKAQLHEVYVKGKITLQNHQQKEGYIQRDNLESMNYCIYFKETENQKKPVKYDTLSLSGYTLESGEVFDRLRFELSQNADSISVLGSLMLKGKASLYEAFYKSTQFFIVYNAGSTYALQDDKLETGATEITPHYFKDYLKMALEDRFSVEISKMSFDEESIVSIVSQYNKSQSSYNNPIIAKQSKISFLILDIGIASWQAGEKEIFAQAIYRMYVPKYSKSTSINTGISYFKNNYSNRYPGIFYSYLVNYSRSLISIPFQVQQNILNKNIRPYFFSGLNFSYINETNDHDLAIYEKGFQKTYGIALLYGAGIEADIYKGLRAKIEYRYENYIHPVSIGVGYDFSKK
ncbi:hypothetical protein [Parasediminibacterium sp. JCM 36343]|uniref:hypothetical protein n=1 Tax=Parasediminibacterium sp. JCM 36343 TaxID=3374279 RepID=UPI00397E5B2B